MYLFFYIFLFGIVLFCNVEKKDELCAVLCNMDWNIFFILSFFSLAYEKKCFAGGSRRLST